MLVFTLLLTVLAVVGLVYLLLPPRRADLERLQQIQEIRARRRRAADTDDPAASSR